MISLPYLLHENLWFILEVQNKDNMNKTAKEGYIKIIENAGFESSLLTILKNNYPSEQVKPPLRLKKSLPVRRLPKSNPELFAMFRLSIGKTGDGIFAIVSPPSNSYLT